MKKVEPRPIDDRFAAVADELAERTPASEEKPVKVKAVISATRKFPSLADYIAVSVYQKILDRCPIRSSPSLRYDVLVACIRAAVEIADEIPQLKAQDLRDADDDLREELVGLEEELSLDNALDPDDDYDDDGLQWIEGNFEGNFLPQYVKKCGWRRDEKGARCCLRAGHDGPHMRKNADDQR
jgi:hypothetical protein